MDNEPYDRFIGRFDVKFSDGSYQTMVIVKWLMTGNGETIALFTESGSVINFAHVLMMRKVKD